MAGKWDTRFMDIAQLVAGWSKDESTKVGAVMVDGRQIVSLGFNGPAARTDDAVVEGNRPEKLRRTIHAELNAMLNANRSVAGCTIYVTRHPCAQCAAALIQAGVEVVMYPAGQDEAFIGRWADDIQSARDQFAEAGVSVEEINNG